MPVTGESAQEKAAGNLPHLLKIYNLGRIVYHIIGTSESPDTGQNPYLRVYHSSLSEGIPLFRFLQAFFHTILFSVFAKWTAALTYFVSAAVHYSNFLFIICFLVFVLLCLSSL